VPIVRHVCGCVSMLKHAVCPQRCSGSLSIFVYPKTLHRLRASISDTGQSRLRIFLATHIIYFSHKVHKVKCILVGVSNACRQVIFPKQLNEIWQNKIFECLHLCRASSDSISVLHLSCPHFFPCNSDRNSLTNNLTQQVCVTSCKLQAKWNS